MRLSLPLLLGLCLSAQASDGELARAMVGVKVFAAFLAADKDIDNKATADGQLLLLLVYKDDRSAAEKLAERLKAVHTIRTHPVSVRLITAEEIPRYRGPTPAGIFISQHLSSLVPLTKLSGRSHALLFSPLLGDMERGVHGGLYVSDRILPIVNPSALTAGGYRIKSFFMEVAKHYESN